MTIHEKNLARGSGFTLVEIMIVVAIIGVLSLLAFPALTRASMRGKAAKDANNLRVFGEAVQMYAMDYGTYPSDSHNVIPDGPGILDYIDQSKWDAGPALGGNYNWEGPDNYPYAGIAIFEPTMPLSAIVMLDEMLDDGNLSLGIFRQTPNGRYTYIVEE